MDISARVVFSGPVLLLLPGGLIAAIEGGPGAASRSWGQ
jgi:hypothetical protein